MGNVNLLAVAVATLAMFAVGGILVHGAVWKTVGQNPRF